MMGDRSGNNDKNLLQNDKSTLKIPFLRHHHTRTMTRRSTWFLRGVVILIGIGALAFLLWEPHIEGRNANATVSQVYFNDPFLAYAYTASIAFFVGLYQAFKLLGYIGRNNVFSPGAVNALRTIKYCGFSLVAMIGCAVAYLFLFVRGKDDIAGGVAMGLALTFLSLVTATAAAVFEKLLQSAVDIKSENDLTV